jgi:hypothetical protein
MVNEIIKIMWINSQSDNSLTCMLKEKTLKFIKNDIMDFWK